MRRFTLKAVPFTADIEVMAEDECAARATVMEELSGSPDTDYIRSGAYWPKGLTVTFTMGNLPHEISESD